MSTRSRIGVVNPDGSITSIYCHSDGYLEGPHGVGYVLHTHLQDPKRIADLLAKGSRSSLTWGGGDSLDGRVYGGVDDEALTVIDLDALTGYFEEYTYLYRDGAWYVSDHSAPFVLLTEALVTNRLTT